MLWKEIEKKFGKEMADKMRNSSCLQGITVKIDPKTGESDIPERDIFLAWKETCGGKIEDWEWD